MPAARSIDPRTLPAYSLPEAAHYLGMPLATLRDWAVGRRQASPARQRFKPVLAIPRGPSSRLSFVNLVEAHVLDGLRRQDRISLQKIRIAMDYLRREFGSEHPLAEHRIRTDGLDLFVERYGDLLTISKAGQVGMKEVLSTYLRRVEWDRSGAARLYLFTRHRQAAEPRTVVIDPAVAFGRPVLVGTGIPTAVIAERYKAGESMEDLASDYRIAREKVEEAIRCELEAA